MSLADLMQPGARIVQQDTQFDHFVAQVSVDNAEGLQHLPTLQTVDVSGTSLNGDPGLRMTGLTLAGFRSAVSGSAAFIHVSLDYTISLSSASLLHDLHYNLPRLLDHAGGLEDGLVLSLSCAPWMPLTAPLPSSHHRPFRQYART
jgi:hypothetical protein